MRLVRRIALIVLIAFIAAVFCLFAYNFYRRATMDNAPDAEPPVIYERSDRPSRA